MSQDKLTIKIKLLLTEYSAHKIMNSEHH